MGGVHSSTHLKAWQEWSGNVASNTFPSPTWSSQQDVAQSGREISSSSNSISGLQCKDRSCFGEAEHMYRCLWREHKQRNISPAPQQRHLEEQHTGEVPLQDDAPHGGVALNSISERKLKRVYFLYAEPKIPSEVASADKLGIAEEEALLRNEFGRSGVTVITEIATASNIGKLCITARMCSIAIHLTLHCLDGGQIVLDNGVGGEHIVDPKELETLLAATKSARNLKLVFVNACHGKLAGEIFFAAGAPLVIYCIGKLHDKAARFFSQRFYMALCRGHTVLECFQESLACMRVSPDARIRGDVHKLNLLNKNDAGSMTLLDIFGETKCTLNGSAISLTPKEFNSTVAPATFLSAASILPNPVENFIGREQELVSLMEFVSDRRRRCVAVWGEAGSGKSAFLVEFAHLAASPGRAFFGRTIYVQADVPNASDRHVGTISDAEPVLALRNEMRTVIANAASDEFQTETAVSDIVRNLKTLESVYPHDVLVIMDGIGSSHMDTWLVGKLQGILCAILTQTRSTVFVIGCRLPVGQSLGAYKVVQFQLPPLKPHEAASLFLLRAHRALQKNDFCLGAGVERVEKWQAIKDLGNHPIISHCSGNPKRIRDAADKVIDGHGSLLELASATTAATLAQ